MPGAALATNRRLAGETDFAVARHAGQARLERRRHINRVLQEERASAGGSELAVGRYPLEVGGRRLGRRAEEQAVEPRRIARRARDMNERRGRAARALVQFAGDRLHVGAAVGDEQHAAVNLRGAADQFLGADDGHGAAYQLEGDRCGFHQPGGARVSQHHRVGHGSYLSKLSGVDTAPPRDLQNVHGADHSEYCGFKRH